MKKIIKASKIILVIILPLLFIKTSHASDCSTTPVLPKIGIISEISNHFSLDNVKSFETQDNIVKNNIYSIDEYVNIVQKYINGETLLELPNKQSPHNSETNLPEPNDVSISKRAFEKIKVNQGDILIQGPPLHNCKNSFYGFFSSKGVQKYIVIDGNISDQYSYQGLEISTEPIKDSTRDCEKLLSNLLFSKSPYAQEFYNSCKSSAMFNINSSFNREGTALSVLENYHFINPRIDTITLLDTSYSNPKKLQKERRISYVIAFPKSVVKNYCPITKGPIILTIPVIKENCSLIPVYDKNKNCIIKYKIKECRFRNPKNNFEKFVNRILYIISDIKSLLF